MHTEESRTREPVTIHPSSAAEEQLPALLDQPTEMRVRRLVSLCRQLGQQYEETPETCLGRGWWRLFNRAGMSLREALEQAKAEGYPDMSDQEAEQAYYLLIHVAYFFEPGGVAETLWPLLPAEQGEPQAPPATSEALGLSFGTPSQAGGKIRTRQQVRWWQRLAERLVRNSAHEKSAVALHTLAAHAPPPLDKEITSADA